jgi:subtilisin family serine protease
VEDQGVDVFESSKWFNGVIIRASSQEAEQLKNLAFVNSITYLAPLNYAGRWSEEEEILEENNPSSDTLFQNEILHVNEMHSAGYFGEGMTIAVLDGGFRNVNSVAAFSHLYANNQIKYAYDFVSKTDDVYQYTSHGTKVLSFMAAHIENSYQGIAPAANYLLFVTENVPSEYRIEEYYWLIGAERADSAGVDVIHSSLGYSTFDLPEMTYTTDDLDGQTTVVVRAAHIASEKGVIVVTSAGNEGNKAWGKITSPADMLNGLAVGSIQYNNQVSSFSSFGPSADDRIKPDVTALGSSAYLIDDSGNISQGSGTSFSAPQVAALAAGVWQAYPTKSALEVVEAVKMSASNVANPDNDMGYGIPSFVAINNFLAATSTTQPVVIYPNPITSTDVLSIKIVDPSRANSFEIELYETSGKRISVDRYSVSWGNNIATVELQHLRQGLYFLKVLFDSELEAFRIVKL